MEFPLDLIGSVGFPIFVAVWLLWKDNRREVNITQALDRNTKVLEELKVIISNKRMG